MSLKVGAILSIVLLIIFIWKFLNSKSKGVYTILVIPTILTFFMMIFMSPYKSLRYVMYLLPIISMVVVILLDEFIENSEKNISTSIRIVIYFDDEINIVDLEYKNNKFIMSDDATRKESGTIYYHTGNKITKIKSSPSGVIYMLENDKTYNKYPICAINF